MANYYLKAGLSTGTGAGTKVDPWPIQDVLLASNPKGITSQDVLVVMTDGSTLQVSSVAHGNPSGNIAIIPVDINGDAEPELKTYGFDAAGLGAGDAFTINNQDGGIVGLRIANSPARSFAFSTSAKQNIMYGCVSEDATTDGFYIPNGAEVAGLYDCVARDSGVYGYNVVETEEGPSLHYCSDLESGSGSFFKCGHIFKFIAINGQSPNYLVDIDADTSPAIFEHGTLVYTNPANVGSVSGIYTHGSTFRAVNITNNHVDMGGGVNPRTAYNAQNVFPLMFARGNTYFNASIPHVNFDVDPGSVVPIEVDADFIDVSTENLIPQNDLSSYAFRKAVLNEGLDWRDTGAFTSKLAGGGGGGGLASGPFGNIR